MKILSVDQIRKADMYTIINEPISSFNLMKRAGKACADWVLKKVQTSQKIKIFVGPGNNGGDGLVIARVLIEKGFDVHIYKVIVSENFSEDFIKNLSLLNEKHIAVINDEREIPEISCDEIVIDSIFGSGLSKPLQGIAKEVVTKLNSSGAIIISIDIPSGLFADTILPEKAIAIKADYTLSLEFPKYSYFFPEHEFYVGTIDIIPIGLHPEFIKNIEPKAQLIGEEFAVKTLKIRNKFSHKGSFGHALLIAGSREKMGAALLSSKACLHSGIGLLSTHIPQSGISAMNSYLPECMISPDSENYFSTLPDLSPYNAIGIGPGMGMEKQTQNSFKLLIQQSAVPMVIDADALNILSENKTWLAFLKPNTILTPHPKEFERLFGKTSTSIDRVDLQIEMSRKFNIIIVLKGANSSITLPNGQLFFNSTGNPGMATAGSGDVLTGIILSLLAQNYSSEKAAILGTYLHGKAGDIAVQNSSMEYCIASDIIEGLKSVFI